MLTKAAELDEGYDLLVLPEYANCPGLNVFEELMEFLQEDSAEFLTDLSGIAKRKKLHIVLNIVRNTANGWRNSTIWIDRGGDIIAEYDKTHLTTFEKEGLQLTEGSEVLLLEVEGTKVAFATCFELYFPEYFARLAALKPDLIVVPTYQRAEQPELLELQARARAMDSGAFLLRCSYSMGVGSQTGGMSMLVHPQGDVVSSAGQEAGIFYGEVKVKEKWMRPASFGRDPLPALEIMEAGRRPQLYRTTGPSTVDPCAGFPRVIAHRGWNTAAPENTLPAFGAAIGLGVDEIEFDIRCTQDGELVVIHDATLERTTNHSGFVRDRQWEDIACCDAGSWLSPIWQGVLLPRFEDVLKTFAGQVVMNVHIYDAGKDGHVVKRVKALAEQYDVSRSIYIAGNREVMEAAILYAPEIERCCLIEQASWNLVDNAIRYGCQRLQFYKNYCNEAMIHKAKEAGIRCNLFYANTAEEAEYFFSMGIDAMLADDPLPVIAAANKFRQTK